MEAQYIYIGLAAAFGLVGVGIMVLWSRRAGHMTHCTMWCPMGWFATRGNFPTRAELVPDWPLGWLVRGELALQRGDAEEARRALFHFLKDPDPTARVLALRMLGRDGWPGSADTVRNLLDDVERRSAVIVQLGD